MNKNSYKVQFLVVMIRRLYRQDIHNMTNKMATQNSMYFEANQFTYIGLHMEEGFIRIGGSINSVCFEA